MAWCLHFGKGLVLSCMYCSNMCAWCVCCATPLAGTQLLPQHSCQPAVYWTRAHWCLLHSTASTLRSLNHTLPPSASHLCQPFQLAIPCSSTHVAAHTPRSRGGQTPPPAGQTIMGPTGGRGPEALGKELQQLADDNFSLRSQVRKLQVCARPSPAAATCVVCKCVLQALRPPLKTGRNPCPAQVALRKTSSMSG